MSSKYTVCPPSDLSLVCKHLYCVCLSYAEYVRVRLVGSGLSNSPDFSVPLSHTRLLSLRIGNDNERGVDGGDRRHESDGDDRSASAMITTSPEIHFTLIFHKSTCNRENSMKTVQNNMHAQRKTTHLKQRAWVFCQIGVDALAVLYSVCTCCAEVRAVTQI